MDAEQLAQHIKDNLLSMNNIAAIQRISPELVANKLPVKPKVVFQVETTPHQTFVVWVF